MYTIERDATSNVSTVEGRYKRATFLSLAWKLEVGVQVSRSSKLVMV